MKGTTTLTLTQETMLEALQMYVDAQFSKKHVVKRVSLSAYSGEGGFQVEITDEDSAKVIE